MFREREFPGRVAEVDRLNLRWLVSAATSQKGLLLFPVNLFRREQLAFCGLEGFAFVFYGTEETGLVALMTCGAVLLDLDQ